MIYELDFVILDKILKVKKLLFAVCISASALSFAQDYSVPAASPRQKVEQQFSMSKISVDYGRPGVKGRKIFGELVPYGQVWRVFPSMIGPIEVVFLVVFIGEVVVLLGLVQKDDFVVVVFWIFSYFFFFFFLV